MSQSILKYITITGTKAVVVLPNYGEILASDVLKDLFDLPVAREVLITLKSTNNMSPKKQYEYVAQRLIKYCKRKRLILYAIPEFHTSGDIHFHSFVGQNYQDPDNLSFLNNWLRRNIGRPFTRYLSTTQQWYDKQKNIHSFEERYNYLHKSVNSTGFTPVVCGKR